MQPLILLDGHVRCEEVRETDGSCRDAECWRVACWLAWRRCFEEGVEAKAHHAARVHADEPGEVNWQEGIHLGGGE